MPTHDTVGIYCIAFLVTLLSLTQELPTVSSFSYATNQQAPCADAETGPRADRGMCAAKKQKKELILADALDVPK